MDMQICRQTFDEFYFDSQSCSGGSDLSRPRDYGTFNKISGKLDLSNEPHVKNGPILLMRGQFICKKTEPLMKYDLLRDDLHCRHAWKKIHAARTLGNRGCSQSRLPPKITHARGTGSFPGARGQGRNLGPLSETAADF